MNKLMAVVGLAVLALAPIGCKVEKTGDDTYKVEAPTDDAERAAQEAKKDAAEAGRDIKEGAKELGKEIKEGARDATHATGTALEKAGQKLQKKSKPGDQP